MKTKSLSYFRDEFINEAMFSLIEAMFEAVSVFSLINSLICSSHAACNCSFENDLRIDCVCYNASLTLFDITFSDKEEN